MYEIEIYYSTGDSLGIHEETDQVGCVWEDIEYAKLALKYINEHYVAVRDSYKQEFEIRDYYKKPWFDDYENGAYWYDSLILPVSKGVTQKVHAYWLGYFETLHSASILSHDSDLSFSTH